MSFVKPHLWRSPHHPGLWASCLATTQRSTRYPTPEGRVLRPCPGNLGAVGYGPTPLAAVDNAALMRDALCKGGR